MISIPATLVQVTCLLRDGHARAALIVINQLSTYRFSALYAFDGDMLRNILFYDRLNPGEDTSTDAPVKDTYCRFVRSPTQPFELRDSLVDDRVMGHPKKFLVRSYLGAPVVAADGAPSGSLCCFDTAPVVAAPKLRALLEQAAPLFHDALAAGNPRSLHDAGPERAGPPA